MRRPEVTIGGRGSNGTALRLTVIPTWCSRSSAALPSISESRRSTSTRCTSVPPVSTLTPAPATSDSIQRSASRRAPRSVRSARSVNDGSAAILNATALAAMTCSSGPPCWPGNTAELIFLAIAASFDRITPPRGPPSVLCVVVVVTWACGTGLGCRPGGDQPGEVRHVHEQEGADLVGDLAEPHEVELPRVRRPAGDDQLGLDPAGQPADLVHVDPVVLLGDLVRCHVVEQPGEVDPHAVREVPAVCQRQAQDRVARLDQRLHRRRVRLRAGVRLHVGESGAEQRLDPLDGESLDDVDVLAAAVVPPAGVALGVLVGQHAALRLHRRDGREVLRRDHLQRVLLAAQLALHVLGDLRVGLGQRCVQSRPRSRGGNPGCLGIRRAARGGHVCTHDGFSLDRRRAGARARALSFRRIAAPLPNPYRSRRSKTCGAHARRRSEAAGRDAGPAHGARGSAGVRGRHRRCATRPGDASLRIERSWPFVRECPAYLRQIGRCLGNDAVKVVGTSVNKRLRFHPSPVPAADAEDLARRIRAGSVEDLRARSGQRSGPCRQRSPSRAPAPAAHLEPTRGTRSRATTPAGPIPEVGTREASTLDRGGWSRGARPVAGGMRQLGSRQ